jgi:hypothetical protein
MASFAAIRKIFYTAAKNCEGSPVYDFLYSFLFYGCEKKL